jgi:hypothetical protein
VFRAAIGREGQHVPGGAQGTGRHGLRRTRQQTPAEVRTDLDKFLALLEPFDSTDIKLTSKENVTRLTRLKTVKPLKK